VGPETEQALARRLGAGWQVALQGDVAFAWVGGPGQPAAAVTAGWDGTVLVVGVSIGRWPSYDVATARRLVGALIGTAADVGAGSVRLDTVDPVIRDEAGRTGFRGGLRAGLDLSPGAPAPEADPDLDPADLAGSIQRLIPGAQVRTRSSGALRRLVQHAVSGTGAQTRLDLAQSGQSLRVLVPDRADLMPEAVAMAADTALSIKARFDAAITHVKSLSFDLAEYGMSRNRVAGATSLANPAIHLNAGYCCADLAARSRSDTSEWEPARPSASAGAPFRVDKVTAHEFGHQLDSAFQVRRYADSIEFRRELGEVLGVPTIEMAIRDGAAGSDPASVRAWRRLAEDVSLYATTNLNEAMAELFAVWWFSRPDSPPVVRRYGQLIEQYFPYGSRAP
jgi:hypothetical protein